MSKQVARTIEGLQAALKANPALARASFRATTISRTDALSTESRIRSFTVPLDEPAALGGTDTAPNPVEAVLAALGSCQAIVYRAFASALGLRIDRVEVEATGHLDIRGFLDVAPVPAGFERIAFSTRIVSPEPPERIRELARLVEERCPVLDTLRRPVEVSGSLEILHAAAGREAA